MLARNKKLVGRKANGDNFDTTKVLVGISCNLNSARLNESEVIRFQQENDIDFAVNLDQL